MVLPGMPRAVGSIGRQPGGGQFDFVESFDAGFISTASTLTATATYLNLVRVFKPLTVSQMTVFIGAAAGNIDLGIFTSDGTNFLKQASTGATAAGGANAPQTINLTASYTFQPGVDCWLGIWVSTGTTLTIARTGSANIAAYAHKLRHIIATTGGSALPASSAISGFAGGPGIWLVAA